MLFRLISLECFRIFARFLGRFTNISTFHYKTNYKLFSLREYKNLYTEVYIKIILIVSNPPPPPLNKNFKMKFLIVTAEPRLNI